MVEAAADGNESTPAAEAAPAEAPAGEAGAEATAPDTTADGPADTPADSPAGDSPTATTPARPEPSLADTTRLLGEQFPALFGAGVVKPVKLRIQADIQQRAPGVFTKKALSLFLHRHTTGSAYLRALLAAETRFDLDGQPAGEIAPEHKEAARGEVERRRAIVEAKKEAGRAAARAAREAARPPRAPQDASAPGADGAPRPPRGDRPPRGPRPGGPGAPAGAERPPRPEGDRRPPRPEGQAGRPDRAPRPDRPGRPDRPDRPFGAQRPERGPRPDGAPRGDRPARADRPPRDDRAPRPEAAPAVPLTPEQAAEAEARRQRAQLLRAFEQSPLSKANFGALKGLSEAALDTLLAQARADRERR